MLRLVHFILSHSIFIAFCAVGLCYQTNVLLQLPTNTYNLYLFIFFASIASYNFYWLISKYYFSERGIKNVVSQNISYVILFGISLFVVLYFFTLLPKLILVTAVSVLLMLLYAIPVLPVKQFTFLQQFGIIKTFLLSLTWSVITVLMPAQLHNNIEVLHVTLVFFYRLSFMLLLCIIFDKRDVVVDKLHGLHSLATDINVKQLRIFFYVVAAICAISCILQFIIFIDFWQLLIMLCSISSVLFLYNKSDNNSSYFFYYFIVDGQMLLLSVASFLVSLLRSIG